MSAPFFARRSSFTTLAASLICLSTFGSAHAEILYHVTVKPQEKQIAVEITVPTKGDSTSVQIANWMPGSYVYGNFYENVHDVAATDAKGTSVTLTHPDKNTWTAGKTSGPLKITYWIPIGGQRRFAQARDDSFVQISGAATYMYVLGRKEEKCKVKFDVPASWPLVTGMDADGDVENGYVAPTYDILADNPVSTGQITVTHYNLRGKDHYIALEGNAKTQVDQANLLKDCRFVSAAETDFFGGAPYHKYVWHFIVFPAPDGAGGLEHLSSTQISLSSGVGPGAQSVLAHEYFHLWNVKRIRSKVLGPFDYLTLPKTGALWWLEGVTDYYASLLPYRYGEWKQDLLFSHIVDNYTTVERNPAHLEVSPNEASMRVGDANEGRGNSNGYKISYYNLGWLCGLCLDTEIRARSNGKHSLDDVIRALYAECKDSKPGFEEDEIRKLCIKFGGPELGDFYDKVVMKPGELPIAEQLAKMGVKMAQEDEAYADPGFTASPSFGAAGIRVSAVRDAAKDQLQVGDTILSVDGKRVDGADMRSNATVLRTMNTKAAVGTPIVLELKRGDKTQTVTVNPSPATRKVYKVALSPTASPSETALGAAWLKQKVASVQ